MYRHPPGNNQTAMHSLLLCLLVLLLYCWLFSPPLPPFLYFPFWCAVRYLPPGGFFSFLSLVVASAHATLDLGVSDGFLGSRGHTRIGIFRIGIQMGLDAGKSLARIRNIAILVQ